MSIDDLCSPVLVKEVRQALQGRLFAFGFTVSLGLAGVLVAVALLEVDQAPGGRIVLPIYLVLVAALLVYVPFHAQQSMRQEDAEGARDLLALSPLGLPRLGAPAEAIVSTAVLAILAGTFVAAVLVTEDERLDAESLRRLARTRFWPLRVAQGLLAVGGGRGVALTLALVLLVSVSAMIGASSAFEASALSFRGPGSYSASSTVEVLFRAGLVQVTAVGVSLAFASIPAHVLVHARAAPGARRIARWTSAISLLTLSIFLPLVLIITSFGSFDESALFFSPAFVMLDAAHDLERVGPPQDELFL